jgi:hypothetical protein
MNVSEFAEKFGLNVVAGHGGLDKTIRGGYSGDLLSEIMGNAVLGCVWLTVQAHQNIVAVAVLREMSAIVICSNGVPAPETIDKANIENIPLLTFAGSAFDLAGRIFPDVQIP